MRIYKIATFTSSLLIIIYSLIGNPAQSSAGPSMAEREQLVRLRERIWQWANKCCRVEGITPWDATNPTGGDGDSILFSALLFYSGETWARENIIKSMDGSGGMWRSPHRLRAGTDKGRDRFSQDHMLGVLLYLVTEYKYGNRIDAQNFGKNWATWMQDNLSHDEFSLCAWKYFDESMDMCSLDGIYYGTRGGLIAEVLRFIGIDIPKRPELLAGIISTGKKISLGHGHNGTGLLTQLDWACKLTDKKFHCHLVSVAALILQELNVDSVPSIDHDFASNPFSLWVENRRHANGLITRRTIDICSIADTSDNNKNSIHSQWTWTRPDSEHAERDSSGWDCIAMINLILKETSTATYASLPAVGAMLFIRDQYRNGTGDVTGASVIGKWGWDAMKFVFSGGNGIIYAVDQKGQLLFLRDKNQDGTGDVTGASVIGKWGWDAMKFVFSGGNGIIYAVDQNGQLLFLRDKNQDGTGDVTGASVISKCGWNAMKFVFSGGNGIIYAVDKNGQLLFLRDKYQDGTADVTGASVIGKWGWDSMRFVFSGGKGILYAVK